MKVVAFGILAVTACYMHTATAQEVDALKVLNERLATKPRIITTKREARFVWARDRNGRMPSEPIEIPERITETVEAATALDAYVVEVSKLSFDKAKMTALPEKAHLTQRRLFNCSPGALSSTVSLSVSASKGWTASKTQGVNTTTNASTTGSFTLDKIGSLSTTLSWSGTISTSTGTSESAQETVTRGMSDTIQVPPQKAVSVLFVAYEPQMELPFEATVTVEGRLADNKGGLKFASQLLSKAERTFPIRGTLKVTEVSDGVVKVEELRGQAGCEPGQVGINTVLEIPTRTVASADLKPFVSAGLAIPADLSRANTIIQASKPSSIAALISSQTGSALQLANATIGPPDGIHYTVMASREIAKPHVGCGFNDVGIPNTGIFTAEDRQYSNYVNGKLIAQWGLTVEVFKECRIF